MAVRSSRKRGRRGIPVAAETGPAPQAVSAPQASATQAVSAPQTVSAPRSSTVIDQSVTVDGGRPIPPGTSSAGHAEAISRRYADRNAQARAALVPLAPGERPRAVVVAAAIATLLGVGNLIAFAAGAKIGGKHPAASGIIGFTGLMLIAGWGMWRLRYWAVLGFMAILAVIMTLLTLLLLRADNLAGFVIPPVIIAGCGYLFMKLVRALSRIQMPRPPER